MELDVNTAEKVSFEAVDKKRREIPVTVKLSQAGTYVLELDSVQPDFQAVSLRVTVEGKILSRFRWILSSQNQSKHSIAGAGNCRPERVDSKAK